MPRLPRGADQSLIAIITSLEQFTREKTRIPLVEVRAFLRHSAFFFALFCGLLRGAADSRGKPSPHRIAPHYSVSRLCAAKNCQNRVMQPPDSPSGQRDPGVSRPSRARNPSARKTRVRTVRAVRHDLTHHVYRTVIQRYHSISDDDSLHSFTAARNCVF